MNRCQSCGAFLAVGEHGLCDACAEDLGLDPDDLAEDEDAGEKPDEED